MAVDPKLIKEAEAIRDAFVDRSVWWDKQMDRIAEPHAPTFPSSLAEYRRVHDDALREVTQYNVRGDSARQLRKLCAAGEGQMNNAVNSRGLGGYGSLPEMQNATHLSTTSMTTLETGLSAYLTPGTQLAANTTLLDKVQGMLSDGKHAKARKLLEKQKPGFFKSLRMSQGMLTDQNDGVNKLLEVVEWHRQHKDYAKRVGAPLDKVREHTAKTLQKILRNDSGRLFKVPAVPEVAALAAGNPAFALLQSHAGTVPSVKTLMGELDTRRDVSLTQVREGLTVLEGFWGANKPPARERQAEAERNLRACRSFLDGCVVAHKMETTLPTGTGKRQDVEESLNNAIGNASKMTDRQMRTVIDRAKDVGRSWIKQRHMATIENDSTELSNPGIFRGPAALHPSLMPSFSAASRAGLQASTAVKRAVNWVLRR